LYYNLAYYKAAAIAFSALIDNYPDSDRTEEYKLMVIKAYFMYANNSIEDRQGERYDKVVSECQDFLDRFPESKQVKTVEYYKTQSLNNINQKNEQTKKTA
jgi:outer membrane protein assembly factor BamD